MPSPLTNRLKQEALRWIGAIEVDWDIAACWHVPQAMRAHQKGWDDRWLSLHLRCYFNQIDRRLFKAATKHRNIRLPRFVTLEQSDGVGWHAHGLIATPKGKTQSETIKLLDDGWRDYVHRYPAGKFDGHLFWGEPNQGGQVHYILKNAFEQKFDYSGIVDPNNIYLP